MLLRSIARYAAVFAAGAVWQVAVESWAIRRAAAELAGEAPTRILELAGGAGLWLRRIWDDPNG